MKRLAWTISRIFDPVWEIPFVLMLTVLNYSSDGRLFFDGMWILALCVLLPAIFFVVSVKTGRISDYDITDRRQRRFLYLFVLLMLFISIVGLKMYGENNLAAALSVIWIVSAAFTAITLFWKISAHMAVNTMLWVVLLWQGWEFSAWLIFILPVIAWSRVVLKKHTVLQTIIGALLAGVIMIGVSVSFGMN